MESLPRTGVCGVYLRVAYTLPGVKDTGDEDDGDAAESFRINYNLQCTRKDSACLTLFFMAFDKESYEFCMAMQNFFRCYNEFRCECDEPGLDNPSPELLETMEEKYTSFREFYEIFKENCSSYDSEPEPCPTA
ncbi:hypothetical protein ElyMa_001217500 [Elysia marginata]|uniref:Uncharacterized protein n=1 Tax=Elysia marginata TaxID=1093978 RepID=A0AAV4I7D3_9GAST|nr:hypothetical protein ElyMa_001217500 [Elysia marginata]